MPSRRLLALSAVVVAALLASVAPTAAAPPPEDVCGTCESHFEAAIEDAGGPDVTVGKSRLDVHVRENGSARVIARNALDPADAAWVANNTGAVARALTETEAGLDESKHALSVRLVGDVAVVEYVDETFGHRTFGGVVVADAFTRARTGWEVNTGSLVVNAPSGYVVTSHDRGETTAVWDDNVDADYVTFAPDTGLASTAATQLALAVETGPQFLANAALVLAVPVLALVGLLVGFDALGRRLTATSGSVHVGHVVVAASAAVLVALAASRRPTTYFMLWSTTALFAALTGVAVGVLSVTDRLHDWRTLAAVSAGFPLLLGALGAVVGANAHPEVALPTIGRALASGLLAAQVWTFAVAGALEDAVSDWVRVAAVATPLAGVVAVLGPAALLAPAVVGWLAVVALFGLPAYLLGAGVAARR